MLWEYAGVFLHFGKAEEFQTGKSHPLMEKMTVDVSDPGFSLKVLIELLTSVQRDTERHAVTHAQTMFISLSNQSGFSVSVTTTQDPNLGRKDAVNGIHASCLCGTSSQDVLDWIRYLKFLGLRRPLLLNFCGENINMKFCHW